MTSVAQQLSGNFNAPKRGKVDIVKPGMKEQTMAIFYLQESNFKYKVTCNYKIKIPCHSDSEITKGCCSSHSNTRTVDTIHIVAKKRVKYNNKVRSVHNTTEGRLS